MLSLIQRIKQSVKSDLKFEDENIEMCHNIKSGKAVKKNHRASVAQLTVCGKKKFSKMTNLETIILLN